MKKSITWAALIAALLVAAPSLRAQTFTFNVDINTASLVSAPNAPYYLDFQLNVGSSTVSNVATISNFVYTGGSATGSPSVFSGTATGNFSTTATLTDSQASPFNEIYQGFSASTTDLTFSVNLTQNPGLNPDSFVVSILDSEDGNPQIYTTAPDTSSLVNLAIGDANTLPDVNTYTSASPSPLGVTATASSPAAVPEPSTWGALAFFGCLALLAARRFRQA